MPTSHTRPSPCRHRSGSSTPRRASCPAPGRRTSCQRPGDSEEAVIGRTNKVPRTREGEGGHVWGAQREGGGHRASEARLPLGALVGAERHVRALLLLADRRFGCHICTSNRSRGNSAHASAQQKIGAGRGDKDCIRGEEVAPEAGVRIGKAIQARKGQHGCVMGPSRPAHLCVGKRSRMSVGDYSGRLRTPENR